MADRNVDAGHVLTLLVDDGVNRNSGLTGLAVANDQLALATADGNHGVNGLQAGLHGLIHRFTGNHAGRNFFDHVGHLGVDRAFAVDGLAQGVHHATYQLGTHRHFQNTTGALDRVAFGDVLVFTQDHGANRVTLQVQASEVEPSLPAGNSSISPCITSDRPWMRQIPSVTETTVPWLRMSLVAAKTFNAALDQFQSTRAVVHLNDWHFPLLSLAQRRPFDTK